MKLDEIEENYASTVLYNNSITEIYSVIVLDFFIEF